MTRFEFAAGLNACLDVIAATLGAGLPEEDLLTLLRLQEDFAAELATLGGRVEQLEADTAQLRAQQFSTVTKLRGQAFFNLGTGFANGSVLAERAIPGNLFAAGRDGANAPLTQSIDRNPGTPFGSVTWLNLDTSFTGSDRLKLQLTAGSGSGIGNFFGSAGLINTFGVPFAFQGGGVTGDYSVFIRELSYAFPLGNNVTVDIGPRINWYGYFDQNRYTFFVTGANSFNSSGSTLVNSLDRGAGGIVVWDVADWLDLRVGYLAENNEFLPGLRTASDPARGLFGGTNTLTGQIGLRPFNNLNLRFLYTRSNIEPAPVTGFIGGAFQPIYGLADDGSGGRLTNAPADTFVANFDWTPANWLGLFGRYSYGSTQLTSATTGTRLGDVNAQAFQFGLAFPNLFKEGAQATLSYVIPFDVTGGREFLISGGGDGGTQQELEFSYRYPLNRNIALMPSVYWIMNANNFGSNPDIFIFNLQTQFSF
ncbi:MAG: porin [Leptolyngbya sp. DLM2.Bin27]|nr:MAG: porin [Leptolyngbya sp. DLM2.Bin27]